MGSYKAMGHELGVQTVLKKLTTSISTRMNLFQRPSSPLSKPCNPLCTTQKETRCKNVRLSFIVYIVLLTHTIHSGQIFRKESYL